MRSRFYGSSEPYTPRREGVGRRGVGTMRQVGVVVGVELSVVVMPTPRLARADTVESLRARPVAVVGVRRGFRLCR